MRRRAIDGMVVAITGASAGIGQALARELGQRGAQLALAARRTDRLDVLAREVGGDPLVQRCDVAVLADNEAFIAASHARYGRIDTLVLNAGRGLLATVADTTVDDAATLLATNLLSTLDGIRSAVPLLRQQDLRDGWRGQIVIVSSVLARRGAPHFGFYSATKAAQLSLAEALRVELAADRIAVTSVHPVGTRTEFFQATEASSGRALGNDPSERFRQSPEHVARRIAAGIVTPRPEVWPSRVARWLVAAGTIMPGLVDRLLLRFPRV